MFDGWFVRFDQFLIDTGLKDSPDLPSRLWNADKIGFCTVMAALLMLARRGAREVHEIGSGSGCQYHTVLGAAAADGTRLPPYILYQHWTEDGPAGATWSEQSGWMEADNFLECYTSHLSICFKIAGELFFS